MNPNRFKKYNDEAKKIYDGPNFWELSKIYEKRDDIKEKLGIVSRYR